MKNENNRFYRKREHEKPEKNQGVRGELEKAGRAGGDSEGDSDHRRNLHLPGLSRSAPSPWYSSLMNALKGAQ